MATLNAGTIDMSADPFQLIPLFNANPVSGNSTAFSFNYPFSNYTWTFTGTGFGSYVNGAPTTGTMNGMTMSGSVSLTLSGAAYPMATLFTTLYSGTTQDAYTYLFAGNDTINAGGILNGFGGNDTINGGSSADTIYGGVGDDVLSGAIGNDILRGEAGIDTLNGGENNDTLEGGDDNDTLNGGNGDDTLNGGLGDDSMTGGMGNDTYIIDSASDHIFENNGEGTDTLQSPFTITLADALENLTLIGTGNINGTGNIGNNIITGTSGQNILSGGDGNDTLIGGEGTDTLIGGLGDDIYVITELSDLLDVIVENAGEGVDTIRFGAGTSYTLAAGDIENLILFASGSNGTGNAQNNVITGEAGWFHGYTLHGGGGDDTLTGVNSSVDFLSGDAGDDILNGLSGDDTLAGGGGVDQLNGGAGNDTASFADAASGVSVNGTLTSAQYTGGGGTVTLSSIERIVGSAFDDIIVATSTGGTAGPTYGGAGNDLIYGGDLTNDVLRGEQGNDTLVGLGGNDVFEAGGGNDWFYGGAGDDAVFTASSGTQVMIGDAGNDQFSGGQDTDYFYGGDNNDTASGGDQWDWLVGDAGIDTLNGDNGGDYLWGGEGDDVLNGGANNGEIDTLVGENGNDTLNGDDGQDWLYGYAGADHINGGLGGDVLVGGDGDDTLDGGAEVGVNGIDYFYGEGGNDTFVVGTNYSLEVIYDFTAGGTDDKIQWVDSGWTTFAQVMANALYDGTNTFIFDTANTTVELVGVNIANLTSADFIFA